MVQNSFLFILNKKSHAKRSSNQPTVTFVISEGFAKKFFVAYPIKIKRRPSFKHGTSNWTCLIQI